MTRRLWSRRVAWPSRATSLRCSLEVRRDPVVAARCSHRRGALHCTVAIAPAPRCAGGLFGFSLHTGVAAQGTAWTAYVSGALGMLLLLLSCFGCVGLCSGNKKLLSTYFAALMFAVLAIFVSGGYSLLMTEQVAGWVRANWDKFASDTRTEESVTEDIRQNMRIIAGITGALVLVGVYLMYETGAKITKLKALTLFLEVANVITLPMGILLVVAALYIADTAAVATAPITAFALFMVGCFVVSISLLGCFGTAIGSRGLILFFMSTVAVLSVVMAAMGIFAFVSVRSALCFTSCIPRCVRRVPRRPCTPDAPLPATRCAGGCAEARGGGELGRGPPGAAAHLLGPLRP